MNPLINPIYLFNVGLLIVAATQTYDHWEDIKPLLSKVNHWLHYGDKEVVYPVVIACGGSLVVIASWLLY